MKKSKIVSIKKVPSQGMRYDIEVEGNHNFFANGVLVHNSSLTALKVNGEFMLCTRNMLLKEPSQEDLENGSLCNFWHAANKYKIMDIPDGTYIQAELVGGKIQGNKHGLSDVQIRVFNVGKVAEGQEQEQLGLDDMISFCEERSLPMVRIIYRGEKNFESIKDLEQMADNVRYENGKQGEGIVVRYTKPNKDYKMQKAFSFKVISAKFALKNGE